MKTRYPVYVISKGRWKNPLTAKALDRMGCPYRFVIEPSEVATYLENYRPTHGKFLVLPDNFSEHGQGSIPVRNWVWEHALSEGFGRHWLLDDNIEDFNRLNRNIKPVVRTPKIFRAAEDFVDRYENIGLAGFNYYSFAKATEQVPPFYLNTRIYSCILIDNYLPFRWRGRYNEDTDLSLRVLKLELCTVLFNAFLAGKVTTMRMTGGNTDELYKDDGRKLMAESLVEQHPDVASVVWKFNRWHHKVDYRPFRGNKLVRIYTDYPSPEGINNYGMELRTFAR